MTRTHWIICLIAILSLLWQSSAQAICNTPECHKISKKMSEWMDTTVDPCQDFYRYSCGGFLKTAKIPDGQLGLNPYYGSLGEKVELRGKSLLEMRPEEESLFVTDDIVRNYYKQCMDESAIEEAGLSPIKKLMADIGGWPVIESSWVAKGNEWYVRDIKMNSAGIVPSFILNTHVFYDYMKNEKRIIFLDQPKLGIKYYELKQGFNNPKVQGYYKYMIGAAQLMGADPMRAVTEMRKVLDFEIEIAKIIDPKFNPVYLYNPTTVGEFEKQWKFDMTFKDYINNVFKSSEEHQIQLNENERVLVTYPTFVTAVLQLLDKTPSSTVANYQAWRVFKHVVPNLNKKARKLEDNYNEKFLGFKNTLPRWKKCVREIGYNFQGFGTWKKIGNLVPAAASLYLRHFFPQGVKETAQKTADIIKKVFENTLRNAEWMEDGVKQEGLRKLRNMTELMGGPIEFYDHKVLNEVYKNFVISEDYFGNAREVEKFWRTFDLALLRIPVTPDRWFEHPFHLFAETYYTPFTNSLEFPAAVMQEDFISSSSPGFRKFSRLGAIYGHEVTHGYDGDLRFFDSNRHVRFWWDKKTDQNFNAKTKCLVNQYGNYYVSQVGMKLNGGNALSENIADNGGIRLGYYGYEKYVEEQGADPRLPGISLNPKQLYWVDHAQIRCVKLTNDYLKHLIRTWNYSPFEFRVKGPFSNIKEFSKDFACPEGSNMNPKDKCEVW